MKDNYMKKTWIRIIIIIVIILFAWRIYQKISAGKSKDGNSFGGKGRSSAIVVELGKIQNTTVKDIGTFSGSLYPRSSINIAPKVSGRLDKITVDIGSLVKNGQIVAFLDNGTYEQDVSQARAALEITKAQLKEADSALKLSDHDLSIQRSLFEKKYISQTEMDQAENQNTSIKAKKDVAIATVHQKEAALRAAEIQLAYTKIRVTWNDGGKSRIVGERFVDTGAMLTQNTPIISILDNSSMTAVIDIIESDYSKIRIGQETFITTDAYPDKQFVGRIARIAPELSEASRQARVEIDIPNTEGLLKPGMFARVNILFQNHPNATAVPLAAITINKEQKGVFLVDKPNMIVHFIPVKTGIQQGDMIEIIEPSIQGEVVTLGNNQLEDGKKIRLPKMDNPDKKAGGKKGKGTSR
jgi:RND family efflux transporter MFP subunit